MRIFDGATGLALPSPLGSFFAYGARFTGGVFVGCPADAPSLRFTSDDSTAFTLGVPNTFTVTTAGSSVAPTITLGGSLPSGVTFVDTLDGTGTLSGTPAAGTSGAYALTFTANNGTITATQNFTLEVHQGPVITSASTTTFNVGTAGSFTVTTTDFPEPTIVRGGAALPSGITFVDNGDGTGTLSGTPGAGTARSYALTFTASNTSGSAVQNFTLIVTDGPAFTSAASTTFTVGSAGASRSRLRAPRRRRCRSAARCRPASRSSTTATGRGRCRACRAPEPAARTR